MENKNENLTDIEKAKELFEYEMTEILLNFREEMAKPKANPDAAYLDAEVPAAQLEYAAPEIALKGIGYDVPEQNAALGTVSLQAEPVKQIAVSAAALNAPENVKIPAAAKLDSAAIRSAVVQKEIAVPGRIPADMAAIGQPLKADAVQVMLSVPADASETVRIAPLPADAKAEQIAAAVPDTAVDFDVLKAVPAELPAAKLPDSVKFGNVNFDGTQFAIPKADNVTVTVAYEPVNDGGFRMPEIPQHKVTAPQYPDVPEKPDISGAVTDILAAVRAEI